MILSLLALWDQNVARYGEDRRAARDYRLSHTSSHSVASSLKRHYSLGLFITAMLATSMAFGFMLGGFIGLALGAGIGIVLGTGLAITIQNIIDKLQLREPQNPRGKDVALHGIRELKRGLLWSALLATIALGLALTGVFIPGLHGVGGILLQTGLAGLIGGVDSAAARLIRDKKTIPISILVFTLSMLTGFLMPVLVTSLALLSSLAILAVQIPNKHFDKGNGPMWLGLANQFIVAITSYQLFVSSLLPKVGFAFGSGLLATTAIGGLMLGSLAIAALTSLLIDKLIGDQGEFAKYNIIHKAQQMSASVLLVGAATLAITFFTGGLFGLTAAAGYMIGAAISFIAGSVFASATTRANQNANHSVHRLPGQEVFKPKDKDQHSCDRKAVLVKVKRDMVEREYYGDPVKLFARHGHRSKHEAAEITLLTDNTTNNSNLAAVAQSYGTIVTHRSP